MDGTLGIFFLFAVELLLHAVLIPLSYFLTFCVSLFCTSSSLAAVQKLWFDPAYYTRPTNPPTHTLCLFAARTSSACTCARPRHLCIHPTRLRLATCSNPPPNMVEKLYVTYNDVCISCTPLAVEPQHPTTNNTALALLPLAPRSRTYGHGHGHGHEARAHMYPHITQDAHF